MDIFTALVLPSAPFYSFTSYEYVVWSTGAHIPTELENVASVKL